MASKILSISKSKMVDYSNQPLSNFWQTKEDMPYQANINFKHRIITLLQSVTEGVICIQSDKITDKQIIKQIFDTARGREVKIYMLVNQYTPELNLLNGVCLIRYELNNTGSFILINPNSQFSGGLFFSGQLTEEALTSPVQILNELKQKEVSELFRHFCYHFWETAKKEITEENKQNNIESKPIDVFHDTTVYGDKDFVYSTLFDFVETTHRGNLSNRLIVQFKKENQNPIHIKPSERKDLGAANLDELLPYREFENYTPDLPDDGTSCKIDYEWTNVPCYLPEKNSESPLYEKWKKESEKIKNHLDSISEKIALAEKKEKTISKALSRFFLGKKTAFSKLKSDIEELKQIDFASLNEQKLKDRITTINGILNQVEREIGEIEQEDRKAKLDEEISDLKSKEVEKSKLLTERRAELDEKQKAVSELLKAFLEKHSIPEAMLGKVKSEWQQLSGHKNKQKNPKEAEEAESKLSELNEIQNQVFVNKLKSEIENIEKEVRRIGDEIKRKEQDKSRSNQQSDRKSSLDEILSNQAGKQHAASSKVLSVPDLPHLPEVGKLYQLNGQHYLAIEYWDEYETGKAEAERLKAKLCAIKN